MPLLAKPEHCRPCVLWEGGKWCGSKGFSRLEGSGENGLMVIAEALGKNEEREALPLRPDAKAGGVYQKALDVGKLTREAATLTNIVRCRPPGNELRGMPYERAAIDHCKYYLDQAVEERKPRLILALGDTPLRELSLVQGSISELRGYVLPSRYGVPLISTYHPSYLARGAFGTLFGVFLHDVRRAHQYALHGVPSKLETHYVLSPSSTDISNYLDRLRADRSLAVAYDIETEGILGIKESEKWSEKKIVQIQFSSGIGEAIVFKWDGWERDAAEEILALPNPKWGWNDRLSDRPALRGCSVKLNGELHDLMNAFGHLQPNFVSSKDETSGDKGVPAKLMSLQSCASFYYPFEGVWKGMVNAACPYEDGPERGEWFETQVWPTLRWYGARDADMTFRLGLKLFAALKKAGLW